MILGMTTSTLHSGACIDQLSRNHFRSDCHVRVAHRQTDEPLDRNFFDLHRIDQRDWFRISL